MGGPVLQFAELNTDTTSKGTGALVALYEDTHV